RQQLEQEQQRRQSNALLFLAKGREQQGRLLEAFGAYSDFGGLARQQDLIRVHDEPTVQARPDIWARGRLLALLAKATPQQRKELEEEITRRQQAVADGKDIEALRRFVAVFGTLTPAGRQAQLQLAERLIAEDKRDGWRQAHMYLLQLRRHRDESQLVAQ